MTEKTDLIEQLALEAEEARVKLADEAPIQTEENPLPRIDVLCRLNATLQDPGLVLTVYFVPDKRTLDAGALQTYVTGLKRPSRLPILAARILADFSNEVVPRYVQVRIEGENGSDAVLVEDRRPKWDNPAILARLPGF